MQVFRRKRYRLFYPAGLISLVGLPLLCVLYLYAKPVFEQQYVMEVNYFSLEDHNRDPVYYPNPVTLRQYSAFHLSGKRLNDSIKLRNIRFTIRQLIADQDTLKGIQVTFGKKASYGSLAEAFNVCFGEGLKSSALKWVGSKNNIWIYYRSPKAPFMKVKPIPLPVCGGVFNFQEVDDGPTEPEPLLIAGLPFNLFIKTWWPSFILLLIMVYLNVKKVNRLPRKPTV